MKVLTTIKSLTELYIDLIDSNQAMLVLNNLPNVIMLNGKSTKDEDDDEDGEGEYEENNEIEEMENKGNWNNINKENVNSINHRNSHLYPQMEEIEEDKNLENNYISENNDNDNNNNEYNTNSENSMKRSISYNGNEKEKENLINKEKKMTRNINTLSEKEFNPKKDSNNDGLLQPNYDKNISNNSNKKIISINEDIIKDINTDNNDEIKKISKQYESLLELDNEKNINFLIDITNEELKSLKEEKYGQNSVFFKFIKDFFNLMNNDEESSDSHRILNNYLEKLNSIEEKKLEIPNYYYFYLLFKKKMKIIQNMYKEILPYIVNKCPELNKNNVLFRLNNELFNSIKDIKDFINFLHAHIESFNEKKDTESNVNQLMEEKEKKINSLENLKNKLLRNIEEEKSTYEKRISSLEKENKMMTEKILTKANSIINYSVTDTQTSFPVTERYLPKSNYINNKNKIRAHNNDILNTNFINHYIPTSTSKSPIKLTEYTNTLENNNNTINYLNSHGNIKNNKPQLITLKTLKDFINELYLSKSQYDLKCTQFKLPKETLEEHMYTFLNQKYGIKNLIIEWAKNVITGIKNYSKKDSIVLLFGKIMRNEQEENARFIIQKVLENIEGLLLYYIKRQNPLKLIKEINIIFEKKKKSELIEEEWKGIIYSIYEKKEAEEIEKKIVDFINKENEKKRVEMFKKYKMARMNKKYKNKYSNNYINNNNSYYLNTINSFNNISNINNNNSSYMNMNTISNINSNNKLSRLEKYNMLLISEDKNILYTDFIKIVLDNHIRFRDKQLKRFVELFKSVDKNKDGSINEDEFTELVQKMNIFKEEEVENKILQFLEKIDPYDNQKITFSECVNFFSNEIIKENDIKGNEKEIYILEKICLEENNKNGNYDIN